MPPAARVGDPTAGPGVVGPPPVATVLIGGMPAANQLSQHMCTMPPPPAGTGPHPPTPFLRGSATVLIGGAPALRMGDVAPPPCGSPVTMGCPTVDIGG